MNVTVIDESNPKIGLVVRNGISGPERDLITAFEPFIPSCFRWRAGNVIVFHEPQMDTGFPDLVVAQYTPSVFENWAPARNLLRNLDLKVLHHLSGTRGARSEGLLSSLGYDARTLLGSLERLFDADMIVRSNSKWIPRPPTALFGIRTLIAVEAKIKNWPEAFRQAHLDKWFASQTFVLSPIENPTPAVRARSQRMGVGVLLLNERRVHRLGESTNGDLPASFGSWMINEWIGRLLNAS